MNEQEAKETQSLQIQNSNESVFNTIISQDKTFATVFDDIMSRIKSADGVTEDLFSLIHSKIVDREEIGTEILLILAPIAKDYIEQIRMLMETKIKLLKTMSDVQKQNAPFIGNSNVNIQTGGSVDILRAMNHIDPLAESYKKKEPIAIVEEAEFSEEELTDEKKEEIEKERERQNNLSNIKIVHSPDYEKRKLKEKENGGIS